MKKLTKITVLITSGTYHPENRKCLFVEVGVNTHVSRAMFRCDNDDSKIAPMFKEAWEKTGTAILKRIQEKKMEL